MGRLIQKEIGNIFLKRSNELFPGVMCTVTQVKVSPDLGLARIYLSLFPNRDGEAIFERLDSRKNEIRKHLGNAIGNRTRKIPEIAFFHDEIEEKASNIDKLIDSLDIPPEEEN